MVKKLGMGAVLKKGTKSRWPSILHKDKKSVSYKVNGVSSGIFFSGLGDWGDEIYIIIGIYSHERIIRILNYQIIEWWFDKRMRYCYHDVNIIE